MALQRFPPRGLFNGNLPVFSYFDSLMKAGVQINPKLCCFEERRRLGLVTARRGAGGQAHHGSASQAAGVPAGPVLAGGNARARGSGVAGRWPCWAHGGCVCSKSGGVLQLCIDAEKSASKSRVWSCLKDNLCRQRMEIPVPSPGGGAVSGIACLLV